MCGAGFPEPYTFSLRARRLLRNRRADFDIVHDNQCLGSGLLTMMHEDGWPVLCTLHHPITVDRDLELAHATSAYRRFVLSRWYGFLDMQMRVARQIPRLVTVSESSKRDIVAQMDVPADRLHIVPVGVDPKIFRPLPHIARVPGRLMTTTSSDVPMKGLAPLLEALAKVRTERSDVELVIIGKPKTRSTIPPLIERLGLQRRGAVRVRRHHRAHRRALRRSRGGGRAVAVRRLLAPGGRGDGVRRAARRHHRRRAPGGRRHRRRERAARAARRPRRARRRCCCARSATPSCAPGSATRAASARSTSSRGARTALGTVENYRALLAEQAGARLVLTVDFDRLQVRAGQRVLDLGCGGGRHTYEAMRRGATVVALDYDAQVVDEVRKLRGRDGRRRRPPVVTSRAAR